MFSCDILCSTQNGPMVSRSDNCRIEDRFVVTQERLHGELRSQAMQSVEDISRALTAQGYHSGGHMGVAMCDQHPGGGLGPMAFAECSGVRITLKI